MQGGVGWGVEGCWCGGPGVEGWGGRPGAAGSFTLRANSGGALVSLALTMLAEPTHFQISMATTRSVLEIPEFRLSL